MKLYWQIIRLEHIQIVLAAFLAVEAIVWLFHRTAMDGYWLPLVLATAFGLAFINTFTRIDQEKYWHKCSPMDRLELKYMVWHLHQEGY